MLTADHRIDNQWVAIAHPAKNSRVGFLQLSMVTVLQSLCVYRLPLSVALTYTLSFHKLVNTIFLCTASMYYYLLVTLIISVHADSYIHEHTFATDTTVACLGTRRRFAEQVAEL